MSDGDLPDNGSPGGRGFNKIHSVLEGRNPEPKRGGIYPAVVIYCLSHMIQDNDRLDHEVAFYYHLLSRGIRIDADPVGSCFLNTGP